MKTPTLSALFLAAALFASPETDRKIETAAKSSDAEKALVTKLAQDVRGTKSVTNDMVVKT